MTWNMNWFVECPFKGKCKSFPYKCDECKHNKNDEDHYEPKDNKVTWNRDEFQMNPPPMRC